MRWFKYNANEETCDYTQTLYKKYSKWSISQRMAQAKQESGKHGHRFAYFQWNN